MTYIVEVKIVPLNILTVPTPGLRNQPTTSFLHYIFKMVANDPLASFDAFLDSVTQMHDAITKFDINVDSPTAQAEQGQIDNDLATFDNLDDFTISENTDSNDEDDSGSDSFAEGPEESASSSSEVLTWLESKCDSIASGGMSSSDLLSTILGIVTSESSDDELQMSLPEVIGYENLDFIIDLIAKRSAIKTAQVDITTPSLPKIFAN